MGVLQSVLFVRLPVLNCIALQLKKNRLKPGQAVWKFKGVVETSLQGSRVVTALVVCVNFLFWQKPDSLKENKFNEG